MQPIQVEFEIRQSDFFRAKLYSLRRQYWIISICSIVILAIPLSSHRPWNWAYLGWIAFFFALLALTMYWSSRTTFKNIAPEGRENRYVFTGEEVRIESGLGKSSVIWKTFPAAIEGTDAFYLIIPSSIYYIVPKRGFTDDAAIDEFRNLLREKLGKAARLRSGR